MAHANKCKEWVENRVKRKQQNCPEAKQKNAKLAKTAKLAKNAKLCRGKTANQQNRKKCKTIKTEAQSVTKSLRHKQLAIESFKSTTVFLLRSSKPF